MAGPGHLAKPSGLVVFKPGLALPLGADHWQQHHPPMLLARQARITDVVPTLEAGDVRSINIHFVIHVAPAPGARL